MDCRSREPASTTSADGEWARRSRGLGGPAAIEPAARVRGDREGSRPMAGGG
eukprot:CAMPEP_0206014136 /NCGR_PEP_ID=MMETSP1464-20131121/17748_1 /ASSEMBLY_ACC=CAM_ASM_001124 /TAXON_ID=119497 /ORGANISM="Exanthemachrysis gayraliae, Strain RCC1523" /LENGTH=51 /DNA_ID=CAMNT_0053387881 /DNA_START=422 /DNA_END=573 /DNA_ORIENTATION=-